MQEDDSEVGSVTEVLPQTQITMLLNRRDFETNVCHDKSNLCCVLVTSTLCQQCGIKHIPYPKVPHGSGAGGEDEAEPEDAEDLEDGEDGGEEGGAHAAAASVGHFYKDVEEYLVRRQSTTVQRRNVRFYHVCACAEEETCVDFLIAADPAFTVLNKKPTAEELAQLHQTAHKQLHELLTMLEVHSTPMMRFYIAGQPVRYSMMGSVPDGTTPSGVTASNDVVVATGANRVKWARVLENAVVIRNAVMRDFDSAEREKARLARAEAKRLAREAWKKQEAEEGEEEDDE